MRTHNIAIGGFISAVIAAAIVAGCGGGGSSSVSIPGGGGGHPSPTPTSSPTGSPSPSPSPTGSATPTPAPTMTALVGVLQYASGGAWPNPTETPAAHAEVDVTCGCTAVAGTGTIMNSTGNFSILDYATPVPAGSPTPNPSYTIVPGRNYMVIGTQTQTGNKAQSWMMVFAGTDSTRDQYLNPGVQTSDTITAAVALWVYGNSTGLPNNLAYDDWNFVTLQAFYQKFLLNPTAQETTLLDDIVTEQVAKVTMYPSKPPWRLNRIKNTTIAADVAAINSTTDPSVPTPCPGGPGTCTNTPTP